MERQKWTKHRAAAEKDAKTMVQRTLRSHRRCCLVYSTFQKAQFSLILLLCFFSTVARIEGDINEKITRDENGR